MTDNNSILAKGFYFDRPREGAPDFVKGRISIKTTEAIEFLKEYANEKDYVNLDLLVSREGKLYLKLNSFKPTPKEGSSTDPDESIDPKNIPF